MLTWSQFKLNSGWKKLNLSSTWVLKFFGQVHPSIKLGQANSLKLRLHISLILILIIIIRWNLVLYIIFYLFYMQIIL